MLQYLPPELIDTILKELCIKDMISLKSIVNRDLVDHYVIPIYNDLILVTINELNLPRWNDTFARSDSYFNQFQPYHYHNNPLEQNDVGSYIEIIGLGSTTEEDKEFSNMFNADVYRVKKQLRRLGRL